MGVDFKQEHLIASLHARGREKKEHLSRLGGKLNKLVELQVFRDIVNGSLPESVVAVFGRERIAELQTLFLPHKEELDAAYDSLAGNVAYFFSEEPGMHPPKSPQEWQPLVEGDPNQERLRRQVDAVVLQRAQRASSGHRQQVDVGYDKRDRLDEQLEAIDRRMPVVNLQKDLLAGVSGVVENIAGIARSNVARAIAQDLKKRAEAIHTESSNRSDALSTQRADVNSLIDRAIDGYVYEQNQVDQMTRTPRPLGVVRAGSPGKSGA